MRPGAREEMSDPDISTKCRRSRRGPGQHRCSLDDCRRGSYAVVRASSRGGICHPEVVVNSTFAICRARRSIMQSVSARLVYQTLYEPSRLSRQERRAIRCYLRRCGNAREAAGGAAVAPDGGASAARKKKIKKRIKDRTFAHGCDPQVSQSRATRADRQFARSSLLETLVQLSTRQF